MIQSLRRDSRMAGLAFDALALVGTVVVGCGCWLIAPPLVLVWAGGLMLAVGVAGGLTNR